jgi:hypothetical protein
MRKTLGKTGRNLARPFLHAATLLFLLSATICPASPPNPGCPTSPTIASVSPSTWIAGDTYTIAITGTGFIPVSQSASCAGTGVYIGVNAGSVALSNVTVVSSTSITATVSPDASDPAEPACVTTDAVNVWVVRSNRKTMSTAKAASSCAGVTAQIVNCPTPNIVSVSPSTWFAGKTYVGVVIKGTGFITTDKATAACPTTPVSIAAADGSAVPVGQVTVENKTTIRVDGVAPPASDPTESATITAGTNPNTVPYTQAAVLGTPQIMCTGANMQCNGNIISVTGGGTAAAQEAVVGQTITLAATPNQTALTALPVQVAFSKATPTTWTVGGTNIGGYTPKTKATPPPAPTELKSLNLTTYWLYPNPSAPLTYQYCVDITGADPVRQCSPTANAIFNVQGPSAQITAILSMAGTPYATGEWWVSTGYTGCSINPKGLTQFLIFGQYSPPPATCVVSVYLPGIAFEATDVNLDNVMAPDGVFQWVQLITASEDSGTMTNGNVTRSLNGPGLDNVYPYTTLAPPPYLTANDSPGLGLDNEWATGTRIFTAQMYLMWNSNLDSLSIPVPIGYLTWSINGTADQNKKESPTWSLSRATTQGTAATTYTPSTAQQPSYGLPTWTKVVLNTLRATSESESDQPDGEEENQ